MKTFSKSIFLLLGFLFVSSTTFGQGYFTISGKIIDAKSNEALLAATVSIKGESSGTTADFDGNFKFRVFEKYINDTLMISSLGYKNHLIPVKTIKELRNEPFVFSLSSTSFELLTAEIGGSIILKNVFFEFDQYNLLETSFPELEKLRKFMIKNPKISVEIAGHTDNEGDDDYNLALSEARASAIVAYLNHHGIDQKRLVARGYGETKPIVPNDTEENQAKNRRVEFSVIKKEKLTPKSIESIEANEKRVVEHKLETPKKEIPKLNIPTSTEPKVPVKEEVVSTIPSIQLDKSPKKDNTEKGVEKEAEAFEMIMPFNDDGA